MPAGRRHHDDGAYRRCPGLNDALEGGVVKTAVVSSSQVLKLSSELKPDGMRCVVWSGPERSTPP
jgi:hypothetical protein